MDSLPKSRFWRTSSYKNLRIGSRDLEAANDIQTLEQPRKVTRTGTPAASNNVKLQQIMAHVSVNESTEATVHLHGLVISSDKVHVLIPST